jgi:hypothetical protein
MFGRRYRFFLFPNPIHARSSEVFRVLYPLLNPLAENYRLYPVPARKSHPVASCRGRAAFPRRNRGPDSICAMNEARSLRLRKTKFIDPRRP